VHTSTASSSGIHHDAQGLALERALRVILRRECLDFVVENFAGRGDRRSWVPIGSCYFGS
jgi:hypothetical protein